MKLKIIQITGDYDLPQLKMYQRELSQLNANTRNTTTHTSLPCKYAHTNTKKSCVN